MNKYLEIAGLTKTQGLKGEIRAQYYCDNPEDIGDFDTLYIGGKSGEKAPYKIEYCRVQKNIAILKFKTVDTVEQAQTLVGKTVYIDREDTDLPEGTFFIADLIGLPVVDADSGRVYGVLDDVLQNSPTDVYSIKTESGGQLLFPAIPDILLSVELGEKITIRPLPNLFELED